MKFVAEMKSWFNLLRFESCFSTVSFPKLDFILIYRENMTE